MRALFLTILCFSLLGCGDLLVSPPENNPESNFEVLWQDFDQNYSYFEYKKINWDSLYTIYRPRVNENTSDRQLFNILSEMVGHLKDGHVNIYAPFASYSYEDWYLNYPRNYYPEIINSIVENKQPFRGGNIEYGWIQSNIGYIHINTFSSQERGFAEFDQVLETFSAAVGLIIDVRGNGGGSDNNVEAIASRFADQRRLYRYVKYRNGPDHTDFTDPIASYISPAGTVNWGDRPVVILTNRECFSATESFLLAMKSFPNVTTIGDYTGGGSGNPTYRGLPNGWTFRFSRWMETDVNGNHFEGIGLKPDIFASVNQVDVGFLRDPLVVQSIIHIERITSP